MPPKPPQSPHTQKIYRRWKQEKKEKKMVALTTKLLEASMVLWKNTSRVAYGEEQEERERKRREENQTEEELSLRGQTKQAPTANPANTRPPQAELVFAHLALFAPTRNSHSYSAYEASSSSSNDTLSPRRLNQVKIKLQTTQLVTLGRLIHLGGSSCVELLPPSTPFASWTRTPKRSNAEDEGVMGIWNTQCGTLNALNT
ncbi:hypothetical protein BDQ12DRAFT_667826 [Crucibulum laeve]|uniref:Uncharacterized protein n=1 Tax=Crucibulum laeve TaxID=68775 RepID=A0A5C3LVH3_9AGAR|nr:hypothetical protein BDQ12DRAFT_667826 [Crucibulum laeve]